MSHAAYFREKAWQCRRLIDVAVVPEIIEQLEAWAQEFDEKASGIENRTPAPEPLAAAGSERHA